MPIFLALRLVCDVGTVCRSGGQSIKTQEFSVAIQPDLISLTQSLKTLPDGWSRDSKGVLSCPLCTAGPIRL